MQHIAYIQRSLHRFTKSTAVYAVFLASSPVYRGTILNAITTDTNIMAAPNISLKARALRYLSMREHSRAELARKLTRHAQESDDIEALLDFLEAQNWLSQARFTEALVNRRVARYGNSRIVSELQSHGIGGDALSNIKTALTADEVARACAVWRKKFGTLATNAAERAKQMRFLQQRGFSNRAIQAVMRGVADDIQ